MNLISVVGQQHTAYWGYWMRISAPAWACARMVCRTSCGARCQQANLSWGALWRKIILSALLRSPRSRSPNTLLLIASFRHSLTRKMAIGTLYGGMDFMTRANDGRGSGQATKNSNSGIILATTFPGMTR